MSILLFQISFQLAQQLIDTQMHQDMSEHIFDIKGVCDPTTQQAAEVPITNSKP